MLVVVPWMFLFGLLDFVTDVLFFVNDVDSSRFDEAFDHDASAFRWTVIAMLIVDGLVLLSSLLHVASVTAFEAEDKARKRMLQRYYTISLAACADVPFIALVLVVVISQDGSFGFWSLTSLVTSCVLLFFRLFQSYASGDQKRLFAFLKGGMLIVVLFSLTVIVFASLGLAKVAWFAELPLLEESLAAQGWNPLMLWVALLAVAVIELAGASKFFRYVVERSKYKVDVTWDTGVYWEDAQELWVLSITTVVYVTGLFLLVFDAGLDPRDMDFSPTLLAAMRELDEPQAVALMADYKCCIPNDGRSEASADTLCFFSRSCVGELEGDWRELVVPTFWVLMAMATIRLIIQAFSMENLSRPQQNEAGDSTAYKFKMKTAGGVMSREDILRDDGPPELEMLEIQQPRGSKSLAVI